VLANLTLIAIGLNSKNQFILKVISIKLQKQNYLPYYLTFILLQIKSTFAEMEKPTPIKRISAEPQSTKNYLLDIWRYKSLMLSLSKRSLKLKYAQTLLGLSWSVLQPLTGLLIFTFFFNYLMKFENLGMSYVEFAFTGIIAWNYFTYVFSQGSTALREGEDLIRKFAFPKVILVLSKSLVGLVELGVSLLLLFLYLLLSGKGLDWKILAFPIILFVNILVALGLAMLVAALTFRYRDAYHIVPYLVNFGIWLTPVFYPASILPDSFKALLWFNPMAGVVEWYRWALVGGAIPTFNYLYGIGFSVILCIAALYYFKKVEDKIVDFV
jgi:lipopolysaccharide transport system permease protein